MNRRDFLARLAAIAIGAPLAAGETTTMEEPVRTGQYCYVCASRGKDPYDCPCTIYGFGHHTTTETWTVYLSSSTPPPDQAWRSEHFNDAIAYLNGGTS